MIAVIVPAHNEETSIARCVDSLLVAAAHPGLAMEPVEIIVVLDSCSDGTERALRDYPVHRLLVEHRNVGKSRAAGADLAIAGGARWLAATDADTRVPSTWLVDQLAFGTDAVCGTVAVDDWSLHPAPVRARYDSLYTPSDGHRHIHGANLGVSAHAYQRVGGFKPLAAHEDIRLISDLQACGASITWTAKNCVTTSARPDCRCSEGFGAYLSSLLVTT